MENTQSSKALFFNQFPFCKPLFLIVFILYFSAPILQAQTRVVTGTVYAFKDLVLKNIQVEAKKAKTAVLTDSLGGFRIVCDKKDKLVFTGYGFETVMKSTKNIDTLTIKMIFSEGANNEEIAIGYGHVSKDMLTYSLSHFSNENSIYGHYTDIYDLIQGKFAGVSVSSNGSITIRGISTFNADASALLVVDGTIVNDISYLAPYNIKTIDILKDGGASIYGSRGANGVVLITTKH